MIDRQIEDRIKYYFRNYIILKHEIEEQEEEIREGSPSMDGQPRGTSISNPTEATAQRLDKLREDKEWLEVVDMTYDYWKKRMPDKAKLMHMRYDSRYKPMKIQGRLFISYTTYYEWHNDAITCAALIAASKKLIEIK